MKQNVFLFTGLLVLMFATTGCRAGGQAQRPLFDGGFRQPRTQQTLGQFGRNFGNRLANGVINRGVNYLINGAISAF